MSIDLFSSHATCHAFADKPVPKKLLQEIYDQAKWGPTAFNATPARFIFVSSPEGKAKLLACVAPGNAEKTKQAPVTAIIAYDPKFYEHLPRLFPHYDAKGLFIKNPDMQNSTAFRNGSLQGAYLMVAARALGLAVGPMSGFDPEAIEKAFCADSGYKANFIVNIGYPAEANAYAPRSPRFAFEEVCQVV